MRGRREGREREICRYVSGLRNGEVGSERS